MLLYSWNKGLDVCVNLTGSLPLTQTRMVDFVPGRAVIDAAQRKCMKYEAKCAAIGYGFLPFSFSSLGELEEDAVSLLKRIPNSRINDPQCELLLLRTCAGISKLYFAMRTCFPRVLEMAQRSFNAALHSALERIVTASRFGFGDWQWRLSTLPFAFGELSVYSAAFGNTFDDALCVFNTKMESDLLSNPSEIVAPKLMKKLTDVYFTRVTQTVESTFSLSSRHMALWQSEMEDHTSNWLRVVPISGSRQTMNGNIYGDHAVSCVGIIGINNVVHDTLVDICLWSEISTGKVVDIGLGGGCDKPLHPADMLLYSWDDGLDVCVDLTRSSPLTRTRMVNFVPGRVVIDAAHRKQVKYEAKCANIGYGFLPFSFSSLGKLEKDVVTY
ncbi:hypothetical protein Tco_0783588 [Tanacetum coccineum]